MGENSTFIAIITINACIIPLILTLTIGRKLYFKQKTDEIEINLKIKSKYLIEVFPLIFNKNDRKEIINTEFFNQLKDDYHNIKEIIDNENSIDEILENSKKINTLSNEVYDFVLSPINDTKYLDEKYLNAKIINGIYGKIVTSEHLYLLLMDLIEEYITKLARIKKRKIYNIQTNENISNEIIQLEYTSKNKESFTKTTDEQKEKLKDIIKDREKIIAINEQERKFNYRRIYMLIAFELLAGIYFPMLFISTLMYGKNIQIIEWNYDKSIFVSLTLGTLSLLPYVVYIGTLLGKSSRHTTDTQSI